MLRALTCEAYILKGNHEVVGSIPTSRFDVCGSSSEVEPVEKVKQLF